MHRISLLLAGFAPAVLMGQQSAGTELWRVAATTLPLPPALAAGGASVFWNPAQPAGPERAALALDVIETAPSVGAAGALVSVRTRLPPFADVVTLAATTHGFSRLATGDPSQDLYGGVELRLWHGPLWGGRAAVRGRYGIAAAHGFSADHQFGAGFELGSQFASDLVVGREGSYGQASWRAVAGMRVEVGRYRVSFARDFGVNDVGAAYRVGLEGRIP